MKPNIELGLEFAAAIERGDKDTVILLMDNKVNCLVDGYDWCGNPIWNTPMRFVAKKGNLVMLRVLLSYSNMDTFAVTGIPWSDLSVQNHNGHLFQISPLLTAVEHNQVDIVRELLRDIRVRECFPWRRYYNSSGDYVVTINYCIRLKKYDVLRELLECTEINLLSHINFDLLDPLSIDIIAEYICKTLLESMNCPSKLSAKIPSLSPAVWKALQKQGSTMPEEEYLQLLIKINNKEHCFYAFFLQQPPSISKPGSLFTMFSFVEPELSVLEQIK